MMLATFQLKTMLPMAVAHFNIDGIGISVVYISKMDNLLKQTVAFHKSAKDMIPCTISLNLYRRKQFKRLTLKKNVAVSAPKRSYTSIVWKPKPPYVTSNMQQVCKAVLQIYPCVSDGRR
jgi:hypothetical protein